MTIIERIKSALLLTALALLAVSVLVGLFFLKSYRWGNCP